MLWLVLLMGLIVISLIYAEYRDHDRSGHSGYSGYSSQHTPNLDDDPLLSLDKIQQMLDDDTNFVTWRLAMLVGIVAALPIIYFIEDRIPTPFEWTIVGGLIFIAAYLSYSWIWARYLNPNTIEIHKSLTKTRDKVHKLIVESTEHELEDIFVSDLTQSGYNTSGDPNYSDYSLDPNQPHPNQPHQTNDVYEPNFMDYNN